MPSGTIAGGSYLRLDIGVSVRATMPTFNDLDTSDDSEDSPAALGQLLAAIATSIGSGFPTSRFRRVDSTESAKPPDGQDVLHTSQLTSVLAC